MKKLLLIASFFATLQTFAQGKVGINTINPQAVLHVDGAKDNPATGTMSDAGNTAQVKNDVIITNTGALGIGTLAPLQKIHVKLSDNAQDGILVSGNMNSTGQLQNSFINTDMSNPYAWVNYLCGSVSHSGLNANNLAWYEYPNFGSQNGTPLTNRLRFEIQNSKNLTTEPPIAVVITDSGSVKARTFISMTPTFPDYVFHKYYNGVSALKNDYTFMPLSKIEHFIKKYNHLPGIQSANEILKDGTVDVTHLTVKNLEKIEDLYLHVIELEKRIKLLESENKKLRNCKANLNKLK